MFVVSARADLDDSEVIDGGALGDSNSRAAGIDVLNLRQAANYDFATDITHLSNIDRITLQDNADGFDLTISNFFASQADANGDGTLGDIRVSTVSATTHGIKVSIGNGNSGDPISQLIVDGTGLNGNDTLIGADNNDRLGAGGGNNTINGGLGTDTAVFLKAWKDYTITLVSGEYRLSEDSTGKITKVTNTELFEFLGLGAKSTTNLLNVAVHGVNDANGSDAVKEAGVANAGDATATGNAVTNDTDANSIFGDTKTISAIGAGVEASAVLSAVSTSKTVVGKYGSLTINASGAWTYTLNNADTDTQNLKAGVVVQDVFTYQVKDAHGLSDKAQIAVTINGATDGPVFTSSANVNFAENKTGTVRAVAAFDGDGDVVKYAISGGADKALFKIDASTGKLSFKAAQNFEAPADSGRNNIYDVTVKALSGGLTKTQTLHVKVTDVLGSTVTGTSKSDKISLTAAVNGKRATNEQDIIDGKGGSDTLTGGAAADHFRFTTKPTASNIDTITDFKHGQDIIDLDNAIFTKLSAIPGVLGNSAFLQRASDHNATNASQRIIYDAADKTLWYDADGNKASGVAAVQIAVLTGVSTLTASDIHII